MPATLFAWRKGLVTLPVRFWCYLVTTQWIVVISKIESRFLGELKNCCESVCLIISLKPPPLLTGADLEGELWGLQPPFRIHLYMQIHSIVMLLCANYFVVSWGFSPSALDISRLRLLYLLNKFIERTTHLKVQPTITAKLHQHWAMILWWGKFSRAHSHTQPLLTKNLDLPLHATMQKKL